MLVVPSESHWQILQRKWRKASYPFLFAHQTIRTNMALTVTVTFLTHAQRPHLTNNSSSTLVLSLPTLSWASPLCLSIWHHGCGSNSCTKRSLCKTSTPSTPTQLKCYAICNSTLKTWVMKTLKLVLTNTLPLYFQAVKKFHLWRMANLLRSLRQTSMTLSPRFYKHAVRKLLSKLLPLVKDSC